MNYTKEKLYELAKRGPYHRYLTWFNECEAKTVFQECEVKTVFQIGDKVRFKGKFGKNEARHPTEDRPIKNGDIFEVAGISIAKYSLTKDSIQQYVVILSPKTHLIEAGIECKGLFTIRFEDCELFAAATDDKNNVEKVLTECTCKSLLFGHDNGCPLKR